MEPLTGLTGDLFLTKEVLYLVACRWETISIGLVSTVRCPLLPKQLR